MRALLLGWAVVLGLSGLLPATVAAAERASYLATAGDATRAVQKVFDKIGGLPEIGGSPDVYSVRIEDQKITLQIAGSRRPTDIDEWSISRGRLVFVFERVAGPSPVSPPSYISDVTKGFFALRPSTLAALPDVVAAAIARADLQDPPTVSSVEIARRVAILPSPSYGDVRWAISLATGRESATVYADETGRIVGADLSGTHRARTLDLITVDDWPKDEAIADLRAVLGDARRIRGLTLYDKYISLDADHPTAPGRTLGYSWDLSGVKSMGIATPLFPGTSDAASFVIGEVDLSALPRVRENAAKAWGNPGARLVYFMLNRDMRATGAPELRWTVRFNDPNGEDGSVYTDAEGNVVSVDLPDSRRPKPEWLSPENVVDTLARIDAEFQGNGRFTRIMFQNDQAQILAEDPRAPGQNADFIMDAQAMNRFGTPMPWEAEVRPQYAFSVKELAFFTPEMLKTLNERTYARLGTDPAKMPLSRYTFSVGQLLGPDGSYMVPSPDGKVTLEIRVESANRMDGGWVSYTWQGEEFDVMTP